MAGRRAHSARRHPRRSQHFLRSRALATELVRDAGIQPTDLVLDLGAGDGRLTEPLARVAARVIAVEVDPLLTATLRGRWANVEVVEADATSLPLPRQPFRVVANLPFQRTTDLLHLLLDDPRTPLRRADLVVEWDVAVKRALPWPSTVNGVVWGAFYEASLGRRLPRTEFVPPPRVDAGVLVLRRRSVPLVRPEDASEFRSFVASAFRKGLRAVPSRAWPPTAGRRGRHARDLDAHEWAALFHASGDRARS